MRFIGAKEFETGHLCVRIFRKFPEHLSGSLGKISVACCLTVRRNNLLFFFRFFHPGYFPQESSEEIVKSLSLFIALFPERSDVRMLLAYYTGKIDARRDISLNLFSVASEITNWRLRWKNGQPNRLLVMSGFAKVDRTSLEDSVDSELFKRRQRAAHLFPDFLNR